MLVVVAGPEGSGTHMLADALQSMGAEVLHRSLPHAGIWWDHYDPETLAGYPPHRMVIIQRRPDVTTLALLGKKPPLVSTVQQARSQWERAMRLLASYTDAVWVSYEAILLDPAAQFRNLARALDLEMPEGWSYPVRDENAKWLSVLECP